MNIAEYKNFLVNCIDANIPAITLGAAGIGKTSLMRQLAKQLDRPLLVIEGSYIDETALQGIPFAYEGKTKWLPPEHLDVPDNAIIFIDDLPLCSTQHLLYPLILDKRIDTLQLPDTINIFAAGNREQDNGSRYFLSPVITNRAAVCLEFNGATPQEWVTWAVDNKVNPTIVTAIQFYPEMLHKWNPEELRNPTPRSWVQASKLLDTGMNPLTALTVSVGTKAASSCEIIVAKAKQMVSPSDVLSGSAKIPKDVMVCFITLANLNRFLLGSCTLTQAVNTIQFVTECITTHSKTLTSIAVKSLSGIPGISKLPEYKQFIKTFGKYI